MTYRIIRPDGYGAHRRERRTAPGRAGHILLTAVLALTLSVTGLFIPAAGGQDTFAGPTEAYAATPTGAAIDIGTATVKAVGPYNYNGKARTPQPAVTVSGAALVKNRDYTLSYKNNKLPGKATITIKGVAAAGYTGSKTVSFRIVIPRPTGVKAQVTGDDLRKIKFSWKKVSGATGYKIYTASNSKFTKSKKDKRLKGAGETSYEIDHPYYKRSYYYKVRAYRVIKGKTYYSAATEVKLLKTKDLKWIVVDLSRQKTFCRVGKKTKKTFTISSGKARTPTVKGTFYIYRKLTIRTMVGYQNGVKIYTQPNVRWVSYFTGGYALHATYWHNNFGHPMSHGCVNMRTADAKWLYKWAPLGTKVKVQQ
jgi:lipoprotein-anchoring transpeptidase ErfK/SrfK